MKTFVEKIHLYRCPLLDISFKSNSDKRPVSLLYIDFNNRFISILRKSDIYRPRTLFGLSQTFNKITHPSFHNSDQELNGLKLTAKTLDTYQPSYLPANSTTRKSVFWNFSHKFSYRYSSQTRAISLFYLIDAVAPSKGLILLGRAMSTSSSSKSDKTEEKTDQLSKPKFAKTKEELKKVLTPLEYKVTQEKDTERPFTGKYNNFKKKGTYHCVVCQEELFSSDTKFESGCGWPSFFDSIDKSKIKYVKDFSLVGANILLLAKNPNLVRTEILCSNCDAHLGHVFDDGPKPSKKRYCVNSASLRFSEASAIDAPTTNESVEKL